MANSLDVACKLINWSSASKITTPYSYAQGDLEFSVYVTPQNDNSYTVNIGTETLSVSMITRDQNSAQLSVGDHRMRVFFYAPSTDTIEIADDGVEHTLTNLNAIYSHNEDAGGEGTIIAPMHGALLEVFVRKGDLVSKGQRLAILEAMKMQHEILADIDGIVSAVNVEAGTQIAADTLMIEIEYQEDK